MCANRPSYEGFAGDDEPADDVGEDAGAGEEDGGEPGEADDGDVDTEVPGEGIANASEPVAGEGTDEFLLCLR